MGCKPVVHGHVYHAGGYLERKYMDERSVNGRIFDGVSKHHISNGI